MRKKFFPIMLLGAMCVGFAPTWAEQPEAVNVYRTDGTAHSTKFDQFPQIEFVGEDIVVRTLTGEATTISIDDVENILFGVYLEDLHTDLPVITETGLRVFRRGDCGVIESNAPIQNFVVFDLAGRIVCAETPNADSHSVTFPVTSWTAGIYVVRVETAESSESFKLIIK